MTYLFSRDNHDVLATFARSKVLLALDYDGTLAPLVSVPAHAVMRPSTRRLLTSASRVFPSVVISGRARDDVLRRLRGVVIRRVVGNHGAESTSAEEATKRRVQRWLPLLEDRLCDRQGVVIENKGFSIAIHYRRARALSATRRAILAAVRSLEGVRVIGGKLVVNLLVPEAPHKGLALERERSRLKCETVIYVGDDATDEDVFRLAQPDQLLSIRVGRARTSAARYYIKTQSEIDRLLVSLISLRDNNHG